MKKLVLFLFGLLGIVQAQVQYGDISGTPVQNYKLVKVNIHFVNHPSIKEGFTETHDNLGNPYSGYDYAVDIIRTVNTYKHKDNLPLHLPNHQKLSTMPKNYEVVLDAVYFHEDTILYKPKVGASFMKYYIEADSVMNVFLPIDGDFSSEKWSGYVPSYGMGLHYVLNKIEQVTAHSWKAYKWYRDSTAVYGFSPSFLWGGYVPTSQTLAHEWGHNFGLGHMSAGIQCMPHYSGTPPSYLDDQNIPISDTPTAYEMFMSYQRHPGQDTSSSKCLKGCPWNTASNDSCSNNQMDYTNGISLSPKQIELIHLALEGGYFKGQPHPLLNSFTVCQSIQQNQHYCDLPYHKFSFYGKEVKIGGCSDSPSEIVVHSKGAAKKIYFSQSVDFYQDTDFRSSTLLFEMQPFIPETDPILDIRYADCS